MGNECKQCKQDSQSVILQTQQIIQTQSHQYSFGMNHIDNDINFEFSSLDIHSVPQFGLEQKKIKANLLPPQALSIVSDQFTMTQSENEESLEQQNDWEANCQQQIQRFTSEEENFISFQSINQGNIIGNNQTTSSELQIQLQQQQQSYRSIQKQRLLIWDSRTVNQELKQKKKIISNSEIQFNKFDQKYFAQNDVERRNILKRKNDTLIKKNEKKIINSNSKKDEFQCQQINRRTFLQKSVFNDYD
ncbi:unnamed protein product [Paramecium sonneborni]|uniref:Uncharacterized protein n=1 Tax=Paramecium sonneborni TaxID=65129 RepID=A0A8S1L0N4_9CILI|nr:unnamed protein product [Paramecium sonneborni]